MPQIRLQERSTHWRNPHTGLTVQKKVSEDRKNAPTGLEVLKKLENV
jgi:hypothetical protein